MTTDQSIILEQCIKEAMEKLTRLQDKSKKKDVMDEPDFVDCSPYEQVIEQDVVNFIKKSVQSEGTPLRYFQRLGIKTLAPILRFFNGNDDNEKKAKFLLLLRKVPALKTMQLKLLEQRIYVFTRGLRSIGYTGPIEMYPDTILPY